MSLLIIDGKLLQDGVAVKPDANNPEHINYVAAAQNRYNALLNGDGMEIYEDERDPYVKFKCVCSAIIEHVEPYDYRHRHYPELDFINKTCKCNQCNNTYKFGLSDDEAFVARLIDSIANIDDLFEVPELPLEF